MQIVATVVRQGSYTKASSELSITQSAISHTIHNLEEKFGLALFTRHKSHVAPTRAALSIAKNFIKVSEILGDARDSLKSNPQKKQKLKIQSSFDYNTIWIIDAIAKYIEEFPDLLIEVNTDLKNCAANLIAGETDIVISTKDNFRDTKDLIVKPVGIFSNSFFCRSGHPLLSLDQITISHLKSFPLVGGPIKLDQRQENGTHPEFIGEIDYQIPSILLESIGDIIHLVTTSDALACLPEDIVYNSLSPRTIRELKIIDRPSLKNEVFLLMKKDQSIRQDIMKMNEFIEDVEAKRRQKIKRDHTNAEREFSNNSIQTKI